MNLAALRALPRLPENRTWFRAIRMPFGGSPLSVGRTKDIRSRFNPGDLLPAQERFELLYLADHPVVAQFEIGALLGSPYGSHGLPHPSANFSVVAVEVRLARILDLTSVATQDTIGIDAQLLTGDWLGYQFRDPSLPTAVTDPRGLAPTQALGVALSDEDIEGFLSLSARVATNRCLVVFPSKLTAGSILRVMVEGSTIQEIRAV